MANITIRMAEGITEVPVKAASHIARGDLVGYNGGWVQADASNGYYAQYIALESGSGIGENQTWQDTIKVARRCTLRDPDSTYAANTAQYLSDSGALTETRPATSGDLIQVVGRSIDAYWVAIDIMHPKELEVFIPPMTFDTTDEAGLGVADGAWVGPALDTSGEDAYFNGRFPSNMIALGEAYIVYNSIGETAMTVAASLISCADGDTNTGDTGTAHAAAAPTGVADNKLCYSDVSAMFDSGALIRGNNFSVTATAQASAAGDLQVLGLYMRYWVV